MSFLKAVGAIILKGVEIFAGFQSTATLMLPGKSGEIQTVSNDLTEIARIVVQVEAIGQALSQPGNQKLANAGPLVAQVILQSSVLVGKKIKDPVLFQKGCQELGGAMADILNSLEGNVDTTNKT